MTQTGSNFATHQVDGSWADRGAHSLHLVTVAGSVGTTAVYALTGPDAGPGAQSASTGWNGSRFLLSPKQIGARFAYKVNAISGTWTLLMAVYAYDASGVALGGYVITGTSILSAPGAGSVNSIATALPANTAWIKLTLYAYCNSAGTLDVNVDSLAAFLDTVWSVPAYFDGDTLGYGWSGTPGASPSTIPSPPAYTLTVTIPQALAGLGWPYVRDITPAHIDINKTYSGGFIVGVTNIGGTL